MALLMLLKRLGQNLLVLHFNHGTREASNKKEEDLVVGYAHSLGLKYEVIRLHFSLEDKNFEAKARAERNKVYKSYVKKGHGVYTAHHLDDSLEWSLMQSFKQASLKSTLGIPVFNQGIMRPFMCVSKKQILRYARALGLSWIEDDSNHNTRFERNFLRKNISGKIHEKYPRTLRHYVAHQNQLARLFRLHRLDLPEKNKVRPIELHQKREQNGSILLVSSDFSLHKNAVKDWIHFFSKNHRGEIDGELDKLLLAQKSLSEDPKNFPFKGPMDFSGGVKIFVMKDHLFIMNEIQMAYFSELDQKLKAYLQNKTQIPGRFYFSLFPQLIVFSDKKARKTSKYVHPLLKETCQWLKKTQIPYTFGPLIEKEVRQKLIRDALILDSSGLGL